MTLTVGSLFSGIGGFDLGLERAGMKVIWQSEINEFANKILKKHWPNVPNLGDITKVEWTNIERPDVICGGYPCQPFSQAGKRKGANDARHLWPAMFNAICVLRPRYALMENVRGHLSLGFNRVLGDLAEIGYDAEWQIISASAIGAPHKRDRIFIVAYPNNTGNRTPKRKINCNKSAKIKKKVNIPQPKSGRYGADVAYPHSSRLKRHRQPFRQKTTLTVFASSSTHCKWHNSEANWQTEPKLGRVANGIPNRVDRLKGLGNAIVPQVAELVGALVVKHSQN